MKPLLHLDRLHREYLYEDGADVAHRLAPDQPVFCFNASDLAERVRTFQAGFPGEVSYAVKANSSPEILTGLARAGIVTWDVASIAEMAMVRAASPCAEFHYHNPVKSRAEIEAAVKTYDCRRFAVDSPRELQKITDVVAPDRKLEIAVRFVLPREAESSAHDFSTKFGADETGAAQLLRLVAQQGHEPILTFHPGSQCQAPDAYARHIRAAARIAAQAQVKLPVLNVGGGFPARYNGSIGAKLPDFFSAIREAAAAAFDGHLPKLECEPGRAFVASSASLLTRVKLLRPERNEVYLNDGIYGALLECSQVADLMPPYRAIRDGRLLDGPTLPFTVFGPTCDPLDRLPRKVGLPAGLRENDFVEFGNIGAYSSATLTRFNGYGGHMTVPVQRTFTW